MLRYAITNLSALPTDPGLSPEATRWSHWGRNLQRWAAEGVDFVQLREKSLDAGELFRLACEGMRLLENPRAVGDKERPRLLVNGRADIAAAARADGVHLTARPGELTPAQVRSIFSNAGLPHCVVSRSCHTSPEAAAARQDGADLVLFGPVFGKIVDGKEIVPGTGLAQLRAGCTVAAPLPVFALGSISSTNAAACLDAGAIGVAGIRLFERLRGEARVQREKIDVQC